MTRPVVRKTERWPLVWGAIVLVLWVALVGTAVAYQHATSAINCINDAAGTRSNVGTPDDVINHVLGRPAETAVADSDALRAVLRDLNSHAAGRTPLSQVLVHAQAALDENQKYRLAHPLGQC